jgi:2-keto-4-pentenoate hydratase/2-oxohepta-3-ene-1,7-dioic acid hydratase in catechol pathway
LPCDVWIGAGRRARGFWLRDADQKLLILGKSYYGYAPLGPWMVTVDEGPNPQEVDLWLEVNGCATPERQHVH